MGCGALKGDRGGIIPVNLGNAKGHFVEAPGSLVFLAQQLLRSYRLFAGDGGGGFSSIWYAPRTQLESFDKKTRMWRSLRSSSPLPNSRVRVLGRAGSKHLQ